MIDSRTKLVLKILAKECRDGNYKIVEISDIIMSLPRHFRMDSEAVKHILTHLERQDMISIKYDDDGVYCLSVLPYGFETLETDKPRMLKKDTTKDKKFNTMTIIISFLSAIFGALIGILISFLLLKIL